MKDAEDQESKSSSRDGAQSDTSEQTSELDGDDSASHAWDYSEEEAAEAAKLEKQRLLDMADELAAERAAKLEEQEAADLSTLMVGQGTDCTMTKATAATIAAGSIRHQL